MEAVEATKMIALDAVIEANGTAISKLELREPTAGEMLKAVTISNNPVDQCLELIQQCTKLPRDLIDKLPQRKLAEADTYFAALSKDPTGWDKVEIDEMPAVFSLVLPKTIEWNTTAITSIELREPTGGELLKSSNLKKHPIAQDLLLISLVSGLAPQITHALPWRSYRTAAAYLAGFTPPSPATGEG